MKFVIAVAVAIIVGFVIGAVYNVDVMWSVDVGSEVKTSDGYSFPLTAEGVNAAVASIDSGTVFVGDSITVDTPIIPKSKVCIDFLNNVVTMHADCDFILVDGFLEYASVKNAIVYVTEGYSADGIHLLISEDNNHWTGRIWNNVFSNIEFINPSAMSYYHDYTGIHLDIRGDNSILNNIFEKIVVRWCNTGIKLSRSESSDGWGNGNRFNDIYIDRYVNMIWFNDLNTVSDGKGFSANNFDNVKAQTPGEATNYENDAIYGIRSLSGGMNWFDELLIWDWNVVMPERVGNGVYQIEITDRASQTRIFAHHITTSYVLDNGVNTKITVGVCNET